MGNVRILLPGHAELIAPAEEWISAILMALPEQQRSRIYYLIANKLVGKPIAGYILFAEGGKVFGKTE